MEDWQNGGFGIYIHWPFCQSKCPYCDFNSHVTDRIDQDCWANAYVAELRQAAALTPGRTVSTVYFGGGTPSLMQPDTVAAIVEAIRAAWPMVNDPEITLEANPTSVEVGRFRGYRDAGINRVSMGIQALDDTDLRRLGRMHSVAEARAAFDVARSLFDRITFDLIYARQDQSLRSWQAELNDALHMAADHLSLYQLTIEDGTVFGERFARGQLRGLPDEGLAADFYDLTQDMCEAHGMRAYEVSNHAREGAESRHNLIYWRGGDYVGVGPGAHGRLTLGQTRFATEQPRLPGEWLRMVETDDPARTPLQALSATDRAAEYLIMGLRLTEGLSTTRLASLLGRPISAEAIHELEALGMVTLNNQTLRATAAGRKVLNAVIAQLEDRI